GSGARNWRRFTDRMSFIVNLFRSQQQNEHLRARPRFDDLRLLELQLDDEHLNGLRKLGDPLEESTLASVVPEGTSAQDFAHGFVERGQPYELLRDHQPKVAFPSWGDPEKIKIGQKFFNEHSMEIAAALFTASLPKAYTAAKGARVLLATAELVSD